MLSLLLGWKMMPANQKTIKYSRDGTKTHLYVTYFISKLSVSHNINIFVNKHKTSDNIIVRIIILQKCPMQTMAGSVCNYRFQPFFMLANS